MLARDNSGCGHQLHRKFSDFDFRIPAYEIRAAFYFGWEDTIGDWLGHVVD
jgi:hypothetical protein